MTDVVIPLRRNLRFQTFWTGSVSATLGQAVGDVAYPLAIVTMTGSSGKAAMFPAVQIAGMLAAGLPAGSLADRYDSQRLAAAFFLALTATTFLPVGLARPTPHKEPAEGGMLAGIGELWGQPVLRATVMLIMGVNTVGAGLELVVIVILRHQAVPPYAIGLAIGIGAAGGLAGAPLVKFLHRLPPGVLLLAACGIEVPVLLLLAVPFGPWWAAGVLFTGMLGVPALRVLGDILVIRQAPPERRGRVVAAVMTLIALGMPVGIAGCGLLLQYLPARTAMLTLAAAMAVVTAYGLSRPELRHARWPAANR